MLLPFNGKILVEAYNIKSKTQGGILIPDDAKKKSLQATVISVSNKFFSEFAGNVELNDDIKPGDTVFYGEYSGSKVKFEDKELLILDRKEILAIKTNNGK